MRHARCVLHTAAMTPTDPWLRFLVSMVAVALAVRITFDLLRPVAPYLALLVVAVVGARLVAWYRGRW